MRRALINGHRSLAASHNEQGGDQQYAPMLVSFICPHCEYEITIDD
jgi:hypothetical protein